ncbi:hypothetical protein CROQUDRAFT_92520, partial [Cronartium quercuum f. sp. fusiforme G11]
LLERSRGAPGMEKLRPISGKGLWELPVSRSSNGSGDEVPSSFGKPEGPQETCLLFHSTDPNTLILVFVPFPTRSNLSYCLLRSFYSLDPNRLLHDITSTIKFLSYRFV